MSTRRTMALTLAGIPIAASANTATNSVVNIKTAPPEPLSEEAARIVSYTIYAEARGEPFKGKKAVAAVIATRSELLKTSPAVICLQDQQFSCWNSISAVPDYYHLGLNLKPADIKARSDCYGLAWLLMAGHIKWEHYTHFYNPSKASPSWRYSLKNPQMIGKHVFGYMDKKHLPPVSQ